MRDSSVVWNGPAALEDFLVPIGSLRPGDPTDGDYELDQFIRALQTHGQVRPVLLAENGRIADRGYLAEAALTLGWTHIAARLALGEAASAEVPAGQMTLVDEAEKAGNGTDPETLRTLALDKAKGEATEDEIALINEDSAARTEWVGLPEYVPTGDPFKVVVSCDSEADRDALFSLLGITTVHKGTRGTLSVWWPDRAKEDLSSLRFELAEVSDDIDFG